MFLHRLNVICEELEATSTNATYPGLINAASVFVSLNKLIKTGIFVEMSSDFTCLKKPCKLCVPVCYQYVAFASIYLHEFKMALTHHH